MSKDNIIHEICIKFQGEIKIYYDFRIRELILLRCSLSTNSHHECDTPKEKPGRWACQKKSRICDYPPRHTRRWMVGYIPSRESAWTENRIRYEKYPTIHIENRWWKMILVWKMSKTHFWAHLSKTTKIEENLIHHKIFQELSRFEELSWNLLGK